MNKDFWKTKSVLVTGGSGFVGRWLVRSLLSAGSQVYVLDLGLPPASATEYSYHQGTLLDLSATEKLFEQIKPSVLIHLAGQAGVAACHERPVEAFESNVVATLNVLEAARSYGELISLVAVSSNHIYGNQKTLPSSEDAPLNGAGMYAASKLCGDVMARAYGKTYCLPVSIARITNSFGGDDPHASHIVTATILAALKGEPPVIKQSGRDLKGYLFVKDTVNGLLILAEKTAALPELHGEAFNLVPDEPITVLSLVRKINSLVGRNLEPEIRQPTADFEDEHLDNSKAKSLLGWTPQYSLDDGLTETINWYRSGTLAEANTR